jgi:outer membrane murein-binding lipoprotein Lpp
MKNVLTIAIVFVLGVGIVGCESEQHKAQVAADMKHLDDTIKSVEADAQWRLDDETATHVFEHDTNAVDNYMKFRKCHEEPPTNEANKKLCASLQQRVARAEAKAKALQKREKDSW